MNDRTALLFPGQGSQVVDMGCDLYEAHPAARQVFDQADALLGFPLTAVCFEGPKEVLDDTLNTQPALYATSLAVLRVLEAEGALPSVAFVAGHSMGELTALTAAGALPVAEGLQLVRERGRLMKLAGERQPGGMAAVLKLDDATVDQACREASAATGGVVQVANYNSPGQVVISGDRETLAQAVDLLKARKGRVIPLAVSIAAHSPLMTAVVDEYRAAVVRTPFRGPQVPVVANITARPLATPEEIRDELVGQLTSPVRWTASIQWMIGQGVRRFVEIGPKEVLAGLVRRIDRSVEAQSVGDGAAIQQLVGA